MDLDLLLMLFVLVACVCPTCSPVLILGANRFVFYFECLTSLNSPSICSWNIRMFELNFV